MSHKSLFNIYQSPDMDLVDYLYKFKSKVDVLENYGCEIGNNKALITHHSEFYELDFDDVNLTMEAVRDHKKCYRM